MTVMSVINRLLGTVLKSLEEFGSVKTNLELQNYSMIKISQNTEKSPGDLRKHALSQTAVKNHQLMLNRGIRKKHYKTMTIITIM